METLKSVEITYVVRWCEVRQRSFNMEDTAADTRISALQSRDLNVWRILKLDSFKRSAASPNLRNENEVEE